MSVQTTAILVLLISFWLWFFTVSCCLCSCPFLPPLSVISGTAAYYDLSADGERNQFLQFDGSTVFLLRWAV